jgi:hypothetical protein
MPVYIKEEIVVPLLRRMRLPRTLMIEAGIKIAGERANVAEYEPPQVEGYETWRWGTRFMREEKELRDLGWVLCDRDQVAGIRNAALRIKLVVCTTDKNTGTERRPKNLTEKGAASRRLIAANDTGQARMVFPGEVQKVEEPRDDLWYYCCHIDEQSIALEVSRPDEENAGFITRFSDRIIVAAPGEIPGVRKFKVPEEFADVPKPQVSRKIG